MRTRTLVTILGGVVVGMVVLGFTGVALANAWGMRMPGGYSVATGRTPGTYSPDGMMHGQYPGGMMGGNGPGGMMGGYGQTTTAGATPVVGVTQISIQSFAYQPANIEVSVGTTVTWTNHDAAPHTVTFRQGPMKGSGMLQQGQSFSSTFTSPGTFAYYCAVHPYMTATVTVTP